MAYTEITVPTINANDETVTIEDIIFDSLEKVEEGDVMFSLGSSKSVLDVVAEKSGYLVHKLKDGQTVKIQEKIAYICDSLEEAKELQSKINQVNEKKEPKATKKAKLLAEEHGIDLSELGLDRLIKEKDVQAEIEKRGL